MPDNELEEELDSIPAGTRMRSAVVIITAILIASVLVYFLSGGGAEFFHKKSDLRTFVSNSSGLEPNADVMLNGVSIGKVRRVLLADAPDRDPNRAVRIDMMIEQRYMSMVPVDSIAALTANNMLGDEFVNITRGQASASVGDGSELASLISNGSFNPADLIASLQTTVKRVDAILTEIQQGNSPTAQFIRGTELYTSILGQIAAVQKSIAVYADPHSEISRMLFKDEFYNQIRQPILNVDHALEEIQRGENPVGKMITSSSQYDQAVAQVRSVHQSITDADSSNGPDAQWLKSDQKYLQIQAQLHSIDQQVDLLTQGNGQFAKLLQSRELYDSLNGQSTKARTFLREFRQDPQKFLRIKIF